MGNGEIRLSRHHITVIRHDILAVFDYSPVQMGEWLKKWRESTPEQASSISPRKDNLEEWYVDWIRKGNSYQKNDLIGTYGENYFRNCASIIKRIMDNPQQEILVVEGLDDLCKVCDNKNVTCEIDSESERIDGWMNRVEVGKRYLAKDIIN